ncbi:hypothetical protein Rmet_6707 (plasmid) [Cupriavidus metallidurans CH34]|uniref:Uncharacterized protein n=1 Tax=Cupriavidus metallidurans (strain ATCC 43123 / DSM 2839 / NBRC 102507 / CH34) TaxID=266264 RepID=D3DYB9_CUPMC|nr:hypothetical protein Rmet_6707 [Cupriavidus metallidurans CH34]
MRRSVAERAPFVDLAVAPVYQQLSPCSLRQLRDDVDGRLSCLIPRAGSRPFDCDGPLTAVREDMNVA